MRKVTIQVESIGAGFKRFKTAWKTGKPQGEFITFDTLGTMFKTLVSVISDSLPMIAHAVLVRQHAKT